MTEARLDHIKVRKYLVRQTHVKEKSATEDSENWKKLKAMSFKDFLKDVGIYSKISHEKNASAQYEEALSRYHQALRGGIRGYAAVLYT